MNILIRGGTGYLGSHLALGASALRGRTPSLAVHVPGAPP
jgi:nucleoside-diphosphate-sugar epimerase